ncbi:hypothetical protein MBVR141_0261 [Mycoplasmopsis bovirhinis]|uniref:coiled-coil domain-containing protein n=1 Tax=Mycoplasmopsis bovirhinis TaxID=29553 RepID=UPI000BB9E2CC|nr:hypothetical protein [Mycoplasmopsis bovirhinis]BBA22204.1 hypothetical protein MBVR141_0261 [Mycoplasmopsis bovirhinis]
MQKIKKFSLALAPLTTIPFVALSCSNEGQKPAPTPNNNANITKINNFLNSVNNSSVEVLKSTFSNYQNNNWDETKANLLIEFVTEYLSILNLKTENLYSQINWKFDSYNSIVQKLKKYDQLLNTPNNSFETLTQELLAEIKATKQEIAAYNSTILEKNKELDDFIKKAQKLELKNNSLKQFLQTEIYNLYNKHGINSLALISQIDHNTSKLQEVINFANQNLNAELTTRASSAKNYLTNNLKVESLTSYSQNLETNLAQLTSFIINNNLTPQEVNSKKTQLTNIVENSDIYAATKEQLKNEISQVYSITGVSELEDKINYLETNLVASAKQNLINKVNQYNFTNQNISDLTDLINTFNQNALTAFETDFSNFLEIWNKILIKFRDIETYISSGYKGSQKLVFEYYKQKAKFVKLFSKEAKLEKISLVSMEVNIKAFESFLATFTEQETKLKENNENDSKTLLDYFKEETNEKLKFEFNELGAKYDLEKYSYSASYNFENTKLFFDVHDNEYVDYQITDLKLDPKNWNNLLVEVTVTLKTKPEISYKYNFTKTYSNDVSSYVESININTLDQNFDINYDDLKLLKAQDFLARPLAEKLTYFKRQSQFIAKFFKYEIKDDFEFKDNRLYATLTVSFNNQIIKKAKIPTIKQVEFFDNNGNYQDYVDEINKAKIFEIINGNMTTFFNSLKFNPNSKNTHEVYIASDAIKAFEESYIMPKFGRFEIFIKEVKNINDYNGEADLVLWYKKDGKEVVIKNPTQVYSKTIRVGNFKLLNFFDLKPKGEIFKIDDFQNSIIPDQETINLINSINESNFSLRLTSSTSPTPDFRLLNVQDLIDQKAFINMEYLMVIGNGVDRKGQNLDNQAYVPTGAKYYDKDIQVNTTDTGSLRNHYFLVFYDVKRIGKRGMSFKLGWINKINQTIRYTNGQEYTLINLVNDYQQHHYPEIMVNNIKLSDLKIDYETLKTKTAAQWASDLVGLEQVIKLKTNAENEIEYQNYSLPVSLFKINAIKRISYDEAYINFKVQDRNNTWINGNIWYKIKGFAPVVTSNLYDSFTWHNSNLKTIQDSTNSITRERVIEPMWDDLLWKLNQRTNIASWTFAKKYLAQTLLKPNARNRIIKFNILANVLINDNDKNNRLRNTSKGTAINVDLDELIASKTLKYVYSAKVSAEESFKYVVSLTWNEQKGIEFKIFMEDNSYKIIIDEPEVQNNFQTPFEKERAFLILPAAVSATVQYTNDEEKEDFNVNQNRFDYNNMDYNQFNQPITFYSDAKYLANRDVYQPNQNVSYELHNGYKLDAEFMRLEEWRDWDVVENAYLRAVQDAFGGGIGTGGFLAKTNSNPNDATFYYMTNMHVENLAATNWSNVVDDSFLKEATGRNYNMAFVLNGNNLERNRNKTVTHRYGNVTVKPLWLAHSPISKDGTKTRSPHDMILLSIDLNAKLQDARNRGLMDMVKKTETLMKMPNVGLDIASKFRIVSVPMIWEAATLGFPIDKITGSITRRAKWILDNSFAIGWRNYYSHIYTGSGSSGSPVYVEKDGVHNYFGLITAGSNGFMGDGKFTLAYSYDLREYNLMGINIDGQHPLSLNNFKSVASQIFKAHLNQPDTYDMPWFLKKVVED